MKVVKYVLLGVIAIVALAVIAVAVIVATFDPNKYKPELARVVKEKTGRTLAIDGNIGLSFFPSIGVAVGKASLSEPGSSRVFASIDQAKVSLALLPLLSRQVVVDRVTLSGLNVELVQHKDGKTNFGDLAGAGGKARPEAKPQAKQAPREEAVRPDIAGIDIRSSTVGWRDEASGSRYKASVAEFTTGRIASGVPGKLSLSARVEATQPKADMQVRLSSGYRLDLEKRSFAFSGIDLKISDGAAGSAAPPTTLQGDLEFDASPQALRFGLSVDRLNLDRYLPPPKAGASRSAAAPAAGGAPASAPPAGGAEQPIDLSALRGLKLKGSLKVGELVVSNVKAEKVDIGLRAEGGRLDASPLAASLYQGSFSGAASVNANGDRFAMKGKLAGVSVGPLLHDALSNDLLEGRGDVTLDVQTGGTTVSALKKSLAGSAGFSLRDAALKGINLEEAIRKARALAGSKAAAEQGANRGERTDFTELSASFVIKNGVAHNEDLSAKSPLLRISGSGDVNIGANSIDYLAKASVVGTATGQGGKELATLRGVTVPVKITGALEAPRFRVDLATTVREAVKEKAEEKLKERARDRLKDLLRR